MVGSTHFGTSVVMTAREVVFRREVAGFRVDLAGVLGLAGELVGVNIFPLVRAGLPLRRVPAVNALSKYL